MLLRLLFQVKRCKAHIHQSDIVRIENITGGAYVQFSIFFAVNKYVLQI